MMFNRRILILACGMRLSLASMAQTPAELRFSGASGWYPIFPAQDKKMVLPALGNDVAQELARRLSVRANWVKDVPWARLWTMMDDGELDLIVGGASSAERREKYLQLEPFMTSSYHPYVPWGKQFKFEKLEDLRGKSVARGLGSKYGDEYETFLKESNAPVQDIGGGVKENLFPMLAAGRMDYIVQDPMDANYWLKQNKLEGLFVPLPRPIWTSEVFIFLSKKSPWAKDAALLRKTLQDMKKDGFLVNALTRY